MSTKKPLKTDLIHITLDSSTYEISLLLTRELIDAFYNVPEEIMRRTSHEISELQKKGLIQDFEIFEDQLKAAWTLYQDSEIEHPINVTLACAYPAVKDLSFDAKLDFDLSSLGQLKIRTREESLKKLSYRWVCYWIQKKLAHAGVTDPISSTQVHGSIIKGLMESDLEAKVDVVASRLASVRQRAKPVFLRFVAQGKYIEVCILDFSIARKNFPAICQQVEQKAHEAIEKNVEAICYYLCSDYFEKEFDAKLSSTEVLGMNLPATLLAGIQIDPVRAFTKNKPALSFLVFAFLSLRELDSFKERSLDWAGNLSFDFREDDINQVINHLIRCKAINASETGLDFQKNSQFISSSYWSQQRKEHKAVIKESMKLALESLQKMKSQHRAIQALTLSIRQDKIKIALKRLKKLRAELRKLAAKSDASDLFLCNIQFFPLTTKTPISHDENAAEVNTSWMGAIIREMLGLRDFEAKAKWIMTRLRPNVSLSQINQTFNTLRKSELITFDKSDGRYVCKDPNILTEAELQSSSASDFHRAMIAMAEHCLVSEDVELVDFGVLALPCSESFIEEAKFLLNQALMDLMDNYQDFGNADEIYQLNLQLFPLTKL